MVSSSTILSNDYRLMVPGLIWGVTGVIFMGITRALFITGSERSGPELSLQVRQNSYHGFIVMTPMFGLYTSLISGWFVEHIERAYTISLSTFVLMGINVFAIVGAASSGTTILTYSPIPFSRNMSCFSNIPLSMTEYYMLLSLQASY
jgi:hypothetical protein